MKPDNLSLSQPDWTWAEIISTYRFWGIFFPAVFSAMSFQMVLSALDGFVPVYLSMEEIGFMKLGALVAGPVLGLYLAWFGSRGKLLRWIQAAGILQFLCSIAICWGFIPAWLTGTLMGAAACTLVLAVPAIIAGSIHRLEGFLIAFGSILLVSQLLAVVSSFWSVLLLHRVGGSIVLTPDRSLILLSGILPLGVLLSLPVKTSLFSTPPPDRRHPDKPLQRKPVIVAFLWILLPFYTIYTLFRLARETAYLSKSRRVPAPWAVIPVFCLIPFMIPILMADFTEALYEDKAPDERDHFSRRIFLWALFFFPVAVALMQVRINELSTLEEEEK